MERIKFMEKELYYTQNNIGSTSMLTDKDGIKVQSYLFTPYGEEWVTENPETPNTNEITRKFTGQEFDKESGLYYYNARYYDPKSGIFITPDPAMDGLNHYAYCSANPINYTDPTGLTGEAGPAGGEGRQGRESGTPPSWCSYWSEVGHAWGDTSQSSPRSGNPVSNPNGYVGYSKNPVRGFKSLLELLFGKNLHKAGEDKVSFVEEIEFLLGIGFRNLNNDEKQLFKDTVGENILTNEQLDNIKIKFIDDSKRYAGRQLGNKIMIICGKNQTLNFKSIFLHELFHVYNTSFRLKWREDNATDFVKQINGNDVYSVPYNPNVDFNNLTYEQQSKWIEKFYISYNNVFNSGDNIPGQRMLLSYYSSALNKAGYHSKYIEQSINLMLNK